MADGEAATNAEKFLYPEITADGRRRAEAPFIRLETLWINTGTLCNLECAHCYIESSPRNDRLQYITIEEVSPFLEEAGKLGAREIGFTGGEPFLNPHMCALARDALESGFEVLILTNAGRPMMRPRVRARLLELQQSAGARMTLRVSLDHYLAARHDAERGAGNFDATLRGLRWLVENGFNVSVAGRAMWEETIDECRRGYAELFNDEGFDIDAFDPASLVIFPEMNEKKETPEITVDCWRILGKSPDSLMCASARMVVKRKNAASPCVVACTLLPYDKAFELGATIIDSLTAVKLNHPYCSQFCVLGGASCSTNAG